MKSFAPLVLICVAAGSVLALAACLVDLSDLSGGSRDAGSAGGGGAGGLAATTSEASTTMGIGGGATTSTAAATSSAGSAGNGGSGGDSTGCATPVLDCSACACPAGGCAAVPLATGSDADGPLGIAISSDGLFWVDKPAGRIMGILAKASAPQELAGINAPTAIAAASGRLFFTAQDGLWSCVLPGCNASKKNYASPLAPGSIQGVAYDGGLVYWSDRGANVNMGDGEVWRCDPANACASPYLIANQQLLPKGLFLTTNDLFWIAQGNGNANGTVLRVPRTGVNPTVVTAALTSPSGLAADATYVYWTQATAVGKILRCAYGAGYCDTPQDVAPGASTLNLPIDAALAGGRIYWNDSGDGDIRSCPTPGCPAGQKPRIHATGRQGVHRIAVGSSCLFWTDDVNGGTVDKMGR